MLSNYMHVCKCLCHSGFLFPPWHLKPFGRSLSMCDIEAWLVECHARTYVNGDRHTPAPLNGLLMTLLPFLNCVVVEATSGLKQLIVARSFESIGFLCSVIVQREVWWISVGVFSRVFSFLLLAYMEISLHCLYL